MRTITIDEASSNLPKVLDELEAGSEVIISRDDKPVARLVRLAEVPPKRRRRVGETRLPRPVGQTLYPPMHVPEEAFAPMTDDELKEWGL